MDNTITLTQPAPMSSYSPISQPKSSYNNIMDISLENLQERVIPRQVSTGANRGELTIKGLIRVIDTSSVVRLIIGYKRDAF